MDPNTETPATPSDQDNDGTDSTTQTGLPAVNADTGGSQPQNLEQIVSRRVQGLVDQNLEYLEQGRTNEMNPKIVQLLTKYEQLAGGAANSGVDTSDDDDDDTFFQTGPKGGTKKPNRLEQLGRQALQEKAIGEIESELTTRITARHWAEDVRTLFSEFAQVQIDPKDPLVQKVTAIDDRRIYPGTEAGYVAWKRDANELRRKYLYGGTAVASTGEGESGDEDPSGADADRQKAGQRKRQPDVRGGNAPDGVGLEAVKKASADFKAGKIDNTEYLRILNANKHTS